jgi:hypothetical protein
LTASTPAYALRWISLKRHSRRTTTKMSTSASLTFSHPELTKIQGEPASKSIQLMQKQVFANARAIYSARGGGINGHLAVVMPDADYIIRTAGNAFETPAYPGKGLVRMAAS